MNKFIPCPENCLLSGIGDSVYKYLIHGIYCVFAEVKVNGRKYERDIKYNLIKLVSNLRVLFVH